MASLDLDALARETEQRMMAAAAEAVIRSEPIDMKAERRIRVGEIRAALDRAVAAERERCARRHESFMRAIDRIGADVADAIREQEPTDGP